MWNALTEVSAAVANWSRDQDGQTLAEYGILVGFIAVVVIAAAIFLGTDISSLFAPVINDFL